MNLSELDTIDPKTLNLWCGRRIELLDNPPDVSKYETQIQRNVRRLAEKLGADIYSMCIVCGVKPGYQTLRDHREYMFKRKIKHRNKADGMIVAAAITAGMLRLGFSFNNICRRFIDKEFDREELRQKVETMYSHPYREHARIKLMNEVSKVVRLCQDKHWLFSRAYKEVEAELTQSEYFLRKAFIKLYPDDHPDIWALYNQRYKKMKMVGVKVRRVGSSQLTQMRCKCGKLFWISIAKLLNPTTDYACSFECEVEKFDNYTPVVVEVNSGRRFPTLNKAITYFGLNKDRQQIKNQYRRNNRLCKYGDYVFCEGIKKNNGYPKTSMKQRFPEVGLPQSMRIPWDPFVKEERIAAEEKFANSKEGKRLLLEQKQTEKWNETSEPIWTPAQLKDYRSYVESKSEETIARIIAEDPFLQRTAE